LKRASLQADRLGPAAP